MAVEPARRVLSPPEVLALIPQRRPFRFVDEILAISESQVAGRYTFRPDEYFYAGHFPNAPITPGVILVESMAQIGAVALAIYLMAAGDRPLDGTVVPVVTEYQVEFSAPVSPGATVTVTGQKVYWRMGKIKARVEMVLQGGQVAASGTVAGALVPVDRVLAAVSVPETLGLEPLSTTENQQ